MPLFCPKCHVEQEIVESESVGLHLVFRCPKCGFTVDFHSGFASVRNTQNE